MGGAFPLPHNSGTFRTNSENRVIQQKQPKKTGASIEIPQKTDLRFDFNKKIGR